MKWTPQTALAAMAGRPTDLTSEEQSDRVKACAGCRHRVAGECLPARQLISIHALKKKNRCPAGHWAGAGSLRRPPAPKPAAVAITAGGDRGGKVDREPLHSAAPPAVEGVFETERIAGEVTIGVTAFCRPESLVKLYESIRRRYPTTRILITDNGDQPVAFDDERVTCVQLPFDSGVSFARNAMIDRLETPYLLLCEEDFLFTEETRFEPFFDVLDSNPEIGVIGGQNRLYGKYGHDLPAGTIGSYASDLELFRGELRSLPPTRPARLAARGTAYQPCDLTWNFGLFRKKMLRLHRWDPDLKIAEHWDYFWRVKQAGVWRVAVTDSVVCDHHHEDPGDYQAFRRNTPPFTRLAMQKAGARRLNLKNTVELTTPPTGLPNLLLLTVGRSGSSIIARMLHALGWNAADADQDYAESVEFREINQAVIEGRPDPERARRFLAELPEPWCLKDPRLLHTAEFWAELLNDQRPSLLWLTRDSEAVKRSHAAQGWTPRLGSVEAGLARCQSIYETWPWPKHRLSYDQVHQALSLFDLKRSPPQGG